MLILRSLVTNMSRRAANARWRRLARRHFVRIAWEIDRTHLDRPALRGIPMNASCFRAAACAVVIVLAAAAAGEGALRVEAYRGETFGVGRVTVDLPQDDSASTDDRVGISDAGGRLLYPVLAHRRQLGRIVRQFINLELPNRATFYFLFRGDGPLELTLHTPQPQRLTIVPEQDRHDYDDLLDDWWKAVCDRYERVQRDSEYPIVVDNYLTANWARRLGREMPEPELALLGRERIGGSWIAQLTANEAYQAEIERDLVLGRFGVAQPADVAVPPTPASPPLDLAVKEGVEIESLAKHVPAECFYERFGSFTNYLWYRDFFRHWKNDLGNMISLRSINRATRDRLQAQLAIGESSTARVMGPRVIKDVAFIGFDYYLRDGAAFGIIFQANSNFLLGRNFKGQRDNAVAKNPGAKLETVQVAGHDVSFLSTPDGKLRSYYAVDGDFHLITTSRRLVERFFAVGAAGATGSLASLREFQHTRSEMPLSRDDAVFLYLSTPFFENMASCAYRTELDRRLRSIGEMRVLEIARMAAKAEGSAANTVEDLIAAKLLPPGFGDRADGSRLVAEKNGYRDSLRGTPGWFLPVADVPMGQITRAEAAHYAEFVQSIDAEVGRFVPVVAAVQRQTSDDGQLDRIALDVRVEPYSQTRIAKWARMLGPAEKTRVAPIAGDVASLELSVDALGQPVRVFGGLRDFRTPLVVREGEAKPAGAPEEYLRGYVGTWPRPLVLLDRFLGRPVGPPDADGISRREGWFSTWHEQHDDFFLFSLQRDVLAEVGPQLAIVEAERPAQIRLRIDDLHDKQIATGVNGLGYMRARQASASASRFMNSLTTQLHVPPAQAREIAEQLVGGRFVDPLGGKYELLEDGVAGAAEGEAEELLPAPGARQLWASTAVTPPNRFLLTEIPADYEMPLMDWFRGLSLEVARLDSADTLTLHAELDMVHQEIAPPEAAKEGGSLLPSLGGLLGWGESKDAAKAGK
jgi:hypothetical protein